MDEGEKTEERLHGENKSEEKKEWQGDESALTSVRKGIQNRFMHLVAVAVGGRSHWSEAIRCMKRLGAWTE